MRAAVIHRTGGPEVLHYTASSADQIARKPDAITHEHAAAIPVAGLTADTELLARAKIGSGPDSPSRC